MVPSTSSSAVSDSPNLFTKSYRSYFTAQEVTLLSERQRGKLSSTREERARQVACGFLDAVGQRIGFPRRVIATAQMLYHRFHLFFPLKDFNYMEVCLSTLYVSSKLHDTLKKPLLILLASYAIRFPHLLAGRMHIDPSTVDQKMLEHDRRRVLSIERLVLETVCFNFRVGEKGAWEGMVKIGKGLGLSKNYIKQAWKVLIDVFRTLSPLQHPPQSLSLACLYTLSLLLLSPDNEARLKEKGEDDQVEMGLLSEAEVVRERLGRSGDWEDAYASSFQVVDGITHDLLNLYITTLTSPPNDPSNSHLPSPSSPSEPPTSHPPLSSSLSSPGFSPTFQPAPYWTPQALTQLKIALREANPASQAPIAIARKVGKDLELISERDEQRGREIAEGRNGAEVWGALAEGLGRNDGTVRFLFD